MLKNIPATISPNLLKILAEMGHGDELILADAHFPAHSTNKNVLRYDGLTNNVLLDGIMQLFTLDQYDSENVFMMSPTGGDVANKEIEQAYLNTIKKYDNPETSITFLERFAFYERVKDAYAVVITSDTAQYANLIIKKGVTGI